MDEKQEVRCYKSGRSTILTYQTSSVEKAEARNKCRVQGYRTASKVGYRLVGWVVTARKELQV